METIHQRIKRLREAKGLTIQDVADACGVRNQSARQWEAEPGGDIEPTTPKHYRWAKLAEVLGVTEWELVTGAPGPPSHAAQDHARYSDEPLTKEEDRLLLEEINEYWK